MNEVSYTVACPSCGREIVVTWVYTCVSIEGVAEKYSFSVDCECGSGMHKLVAAENVPEHLLRDAEERWARMHSRATSTHGLVSTDLHFRPDSPAKQMLESARCPAVEVADHWWLVMRDVLGCDVYYSRRTGEYRIQGPQLSVTVANCAELVRYLEGSC